MELWTNTSTFSTNRRDCAGSLNLLEFIASSRAGASIPLIKYDRLGFPIPRAECSFSLMMEEVYEFAIGLNTFKLSGFVDPVRARRRIENDDWEGIKEMADVVNARVQDADQSLLGGTAGDPKLKEVFRFLWEADVGFLFLVPRRRRKQRHRPGAGGIFFHEQLLLQFVPVVAHGRICVVSTIGIKMMKWSTSLEVFFLIGPKRERPGAGRDHRPSSKNLFRLMYPAVLPPTLFR